MSSPRPHERQAIALGAVMVIVAVLVVLAIHLGHSPPG